MTCTLSQGRELYIELLSASVLLLPSTTVTMVATAPARLMTALW